MYREGMDARDGGLCITDCKGKIAMQTVGHFTLALRRQPFLGAGSGGTDSPGQPGPHSETTAGPYCVVWSTLRRLQDSINGKQDH
jgi:hypothetical protein